MYTRLEGIVESAHAGRVAARRGARGSERGHGVRDPEDGVRSMRE